MDPADDPEKWVTIISPEKWHLNDEAVYPWAVAGMFLLAIVTYWVLKRVTAPFGKHVKRGWGATMGVREGWITMESPALWATMIFFSAGEHKYDTGPLWLLRIYQFHYFNRTIIYPMRMKVQGKGIPVVVVMAGFFYNVYNAYLQGRWLSHYGSYESSWLTSPQFLIGTLLFFTGFIINFRSDSILLSLRIDEHDRNYKIPHGFLFDYVTCPNYFGEVVEWLGWSILTWSPTGLAFFVYTVANLVPRAVSTREWYVNKFPDFPRKRKYVIPGVY